MNTKYQRYQRQLILDGFGEEAQENLMAAKVLIVGAGGLGNPALQYLTAAGIGSIGIVDFDIISLSNLQRQVIYTMDDIGKGKAETAAQKMRALNPDIKIDSYNEKLQNENAFQLISRYDIVLDGSDNYATRYLVNDACCILNKTLVYGAVLKFEGQVGVFNCMYDNNKLSTNYRDVFPTPPKHGLSCNDIGVLGVLPGIVGVMQAAEVIKIITGIGEPLINKISTINLLNNSTYTIEIPQQKNAIEKMPKTKEEFMSFNYDWFCNSTLGHSEINMDEMELICKSQQTMLIDVREMDELPIIKRKNIIKIPLSIFEERIITLPVDTALVFICQSGKRSQLALQMFSKQYPDKAAYSLKGGMEAWQQKLI